MQRLSRCAYVHGSADKTAAAALIDVFLADFSPEADVRFQKFFSFRRTPASRGIIGETTRWKRAPDVKNRLNYAPSGLHHVGALKKCGVADHAVAQQTLVPGSVFRAEIGCVVEIHLYTAKMHHRTGDFCAEAE